MLADAFSSVIQKVSNEKWLSHGMHRLPERRKAALSFGGEDGLGTIESMRFIYIYTYLYIYIYFDQCRGYLLCSALSYDILEDLHQTRVVRSFMYAVYLY